MKNAENAMEGKREEKERIAGRISARAAAEVSNPTDPAALLHFGEMFRDEAKAYCDFIESLPKEKPALFYRSLHSLLSPLVHFGVLLSRLNVPIPEDYEGPTLTGEQKQGIRQKLGDLTSQDTMELVEYLSDSATRDETGSVCMFWDDLSDIYRDLKDGVMLWDKGIDDARKEAMWQWRFNFEGHWGPHLYNALRTMHLMRFTLYKD